MIRLGGNDDEDDEKKKERARCEEDWTTDLRSRVGLSLREGERGEGKRG
jgi:hypothetical protein